MSIIRNTNTTFGVYDIKLEKIIWPTPVNSINYVDQTMEKLSAGKCTISTGPTGHSWIEYFPYFLDLESADDLFNAIGRIVPWEEKTCNIRGKNYKMPRLMAWYGPLEYKFCGAGFQSCSEWPAAILEIKRSVEKATNTTYNSVFLNLYRDESDSVSWHSDNEGLMGCNPTIASVSLGAVRCFELEKNKGKNSQHKGFHYVNLTHGSLVVMSGAVQHDWRHRVGKDFNRPCGKRINLTFRTVFAK
jgi:alpha-ketoglutarate-dependent dioxygenase alkB family protein 3